MAKPPTCTPSCAPSERLEKPKRSRNKHLSVFLVSNLDLLADYWGSGCHATHMHVFRGFLADLGLLHFPGYRAVFHWLLIINWLIIGVADVCTLCCEYGMDV